MANEKEKTAAIALTADDLKEILSEAIQAARQPIVTDADLKRIETDQQLRQQQAALIAEGAMNKREMQKRCTHERKDGSSRTVWVQDGTQNGFILCQKCQLICRPGTAPKDYQGNATYDTELFNRLFQASRASGIVD